MLLGTSFLDWLRGYVRLIKKNVLLTHDLISLQINHGDLIATWKPNVKKMFISYSETGKAEKRAGASITLSFK